MFSDVKICPQCDAGVKGDICLNCGEVLTNVSEQSNVKVRSIFSDIVEADSSIITKPTKRVSLKFKSLPILILSVVLFAISIFSYWRFIYFTPNYVSPLVLSKHDIRSEVSVADVSDEREKVVILEAGLTEGNFDQYNFAQFAPPDIDLLIQVFDVEKIFEKFFEKGVLESIKSEFKLSDGDLSDLFSSGFVVIYPEDNFDKWGFVIRTADDKFVKERVDLFNKKKELPKYEFKNYYATVVGVAPSPMLRREDDSVDYYLLISNSKEFLDQMKESSEGNVTNLAVDIKFSQLKVELPKVGQVFVYHKQDAEIWSLFSDWVAPKYDYVGLDKILKAINTPAIVFYSNSSKLKIRSADIM